MSTAGRPSRRDFLQGWAAVDALAGAAAGPGAGALQTSPIASARNRPGALLSLRRRAMACEFEVQLAANRRDGSTERVLAALDLLETLEAQMTIYRADSEVLRINRTAAQRPVAVEPRLFAILQLAARLHRETHGAFDITSGPLSEAWGFSRRQGQLPSDAAIAAALERVGMDDVELDAANRSVRFLRPGLSLHLNSIGKGYALDRMAEQLDTISAEYGDAVGDYLLHGGRSSVLARGSCPVDAGSKGNRPVWTIGIPHPLAPGRRLAEVDLVDEAIGTSGSGTQFFEHAGKRFGHLLDPRTGSPAEGVYSATVVAPTAAEADALSTAFYVMGVDEAADYCAGHPEMGAILVAAGEATGEVQVSILGLDASRWRQVTE